MGVAQRALVTEKQGRRERACVRSFMERQSRRISHASSRDRHRLRVCVCVLSREQRTRGEEEEDTGRMMEERAEEDGESRERLSPSRVI